MIRNFSYSPLSKWGCTFCIIMSGFSLYATEQPRPVSTQQTALLESLNDARNVLERFDQAVACFRVSNDTGILYRMTDVIMETPPGEAKHAAIDKVVAFIREECLSEGAKTNCAAVLDCLRRIAAPSYRPEYGKEQAVAVVYDVLSSAQAIATRYAAAELLEGIAGSDPCQADAIVAMLDCRLAAEQSKPSKSSEYLSPASFKMLSNRLHEWVEQRDCDEGHVSRAHPLILEGEYFRIKMLSREQLFQVVEKLNSGLQYGGYSQAGYHSIIWRLTAADLSLEDVARLLSLGVFRIGRAVGVETGSVKEKRRLDLLLDYIEDQYLHKRYADVAMVQELSCCLCRLPNSGLREDESLYGAERITLLILKFTGCSDRVVRDRALHEITHAAAESNLATRKEVTRTLELMIAKGDNNPETRDQNADAASHLAELKARLDEVRGLVDKCQDIVQ